MTAKGIKYPGKLGKPYRTPEPDVMDALSADPGETLTTTFEKLKQRKEMELLLELFEHYEISHDDELKWFQLARKLAIAHVPAFRDPGRRPGRPRKEIDFDGLSLAEMQARIAGKSGRPGPKRKWTDKLSRDLVRRVRQICRDRGFQGRGATKKALTHFIEEWARQRGESPQKAVLRYLGYSQKRYSEAKKKFPELAR